MEYLIRDRGRKQKAHIWTGADTLCRMASAGGLNMARFNVCDDPRGKEVCRMCANVKAREDREDRE